MRVLQKFVDSYLEKFVKTCRELDLEYEIQLKSDAGQALEHCSSGLLQYLVQPQTGF